MTTGQSLYLKAGGEAAVRAAVGQLYRLLLTDDRLAPYFATTDLDTVEAHMIALLSQVLGGPEEYTGRELRAAHTGLDIAEEHYDLTAAYLIGILAGLGADDEVLTAVRSVLTTVKPDVTA